MTRINITSTNSTHRFFKLLHKASYYLLLQSFLSTTNRKPLFPDLLATTERRYNPWIYQLTLKGAPTPKIYQQPLEVATTLDLQATTCLTSMIHLSCNFHTQIKKPSFLQDKTNFPPSPTPSTIFDYL